MGKTGGRKVAEGPLDSGGLGGCDMVQAYRNKSFSGLTQIKRKKAAHEAAFFK
jgi:hypothetical protein